MIWLRVAQGVLCAVEICGLYYLLQVFFDKRSNKAWSNILWFLSGVLLWGLTVYHRETVAMYSRYYMFLCITLFVLVSISFYRVKFIKALLISSLYFVILYFLDLLFSYTGQYFFISIDFINCVQNELCWKRILTMSISRAILCIGLIGIIKKKKLIGQTFDKYQLMFWGFVSVVYIGLYFCKRIYYVPYRLKGSTDFYFILFPSLLILFFIIIVIYIMYIEKKNEIHLVNSQNNLIEKNYQEMFLLYQKRERVFHDMKNHLAVLSMLIAERDLDRAESYIGKVTEPILKLEHKKYTGNRIVDIILADKIEKAENNDIDFMVKTGIISEGRIQDIDWCSILSNLLDNAIEACLKLKESERWIKININQNECATIINISNTFDGKIQRDNGWLKSSKNNEYMHGLGIKSVQNSVEKYNGILEYRAEMKIFKINISLFY